MDGKCKAFFAPPSRVYPLPECPGLCRRAASRGLDKHLRMGEGRVTRGNGWGRTRKWRIGEC
jgi:hypothetical protein